MKRLILAFLVALALCVSASAANEIAGTTRAMSTLDNMFVQNGAFGFSPFAADPFACAAATERAVYYNTVSKTVFVCNASAWVGLGGVSSPITGDFVATGKWTFGTAADALNSVRLGETAGAIVFEGATADAFETTLIAADTTASDKTVTIPNLTGTLAVTNNSGYQVWSGAQEFGTSSSVVTDNVGWYFGTGLDFLPIYVTSLTPDSMYFGFPADSNSIHFGEKGDFSYDFNNGPCGTSACADPTLIIHSHNQATNEWLSLSHDGTNGVIDVGTAGVSFPDQILGRQASNRTSPMIGPVSNATYGIGFNTGSLEWYINNNNVPWVLMAPQAGAQGIALVGQYGYNWVTSAGAAPSTGFLRKTELTPDSIIIATEAAVANSVHIGEYGDSAYDFNNGPCLTAACTDPTLIIHSHTQGTTGWIAANHNDTSAVIDSGAGGVQTRSAGATKTWAGPKTYTLADNTATAVLNITQPADSACSVTIQYRASTQNASDIQLQEGEISMTSYERPGAATYACQASEHGVPNALLSTVGYVETVSCTAAAITVLSVAFDSLLDTATTFEYNVTHNSGCVIAAP